MSETTYRVLPAEEFHKLKPLFAAMNKALPIPMFARVVVAEREGEIVGFLVGQLALHVEPLWIDPKERGKVSWMRMLHMHEQELMQPYYVFAPNDKIATMCQLSGLEKLDWEIFVKEAN